MALDGVLAAIDRDLDNSLARLFGALREQTYDGYREIGLVGTIFQASPVQCVPRSHFFHL
jgi:hypothetical protein